MSAADTKALIRRVVERLGDEVPALKQLKLVIRLELRARGGGDVPIWRWITFPSNLVTAGSPVTRTWPCS